MKEQRQTTAEGHDAACLATNELHEDPRISSFKMCFWHHTNLSNPTKSSSVMEIIFKNLEHRQLWY